MLTDQGKIALQKNIQSNVHEIYAVSFDEMDVIIRSSPNGNKEGVQTAWKNIKSQVGVGASYYASFDDVVTASKLVGDLGGFGAKAYIKVANRISLSRGTPVCVRS